jgi:hypothetical protein
MDDECNWKLRDGPGRQFAGKVTCVESRDFWRDVDVSPANQDCHYNRNAQIYMEVGNALGWAMAELVNKQSKWPGLVVNQADERDWMNIKNITP